VKGEFTRYQNYLLTVLLVVAAFSTVDGVALGLLLQDIKVDLHLSDTQLGLLTGMAFAFFYAVMGIPIARWADRGNRVAIIALTTALWSVMVALYAVAGNFLQLLLIRVGVAVGEAGSNPAAFSLIADNFTRAHRPRAVGRYTLGWPLCWLVGNFVTGWLNQWFGWRITFVLLGLPGLGVAALAWITLKEPRLAKPALGSDSDAPLSKPENKEGLGESGKDERSPSLKDVARGLWANTTVRHLLFFQVIVTFFSIGAAQFQPAFLIRSYGLKTGELGTWFAVISGLTALLGTYWGGEWASRRAANDERLQLKAMAVAYSVLALAAAIMYLSSHRYTAIAMMGISGFVATLPTGPLWATLQTLLPAKKRATSTACIFLLSNLIGAGLGPLAAGALSDALHPLLGQESLRYALLAFSPGYVWGGWHLWRASQTVTRDMEAAQESPSKELL
jgi:predicted MFS family arabinose efflux permease